MTCCNVLYIPPGIILSKKCSTAQSFICKAVTSYKIHTLTVEILGLDKSISRHNCFVERLFIIDFTDQNINYGWI